MDALRIREETGLEFRSKNGNMHACGHDCHTAMLLGAAQLLRQHQEELQGTVRLVFQPDEEGFTGAKAMLAAGILEGAPRPQAAMALHVNSGTPSGLVLCGRGTFMAGCTLFRITVKGVGCHGAMPETRGGPHQHCRPHLPVPSRTDRPGAGGQNPGGGDSGPFLRRRGRPTSFPETA